MSEENTSEDLTRTLAEIFKPHNRVSLPEFDALLSLVVRAWAADSAGKITRIVLTSRDANSVTHAHIFTSAPASYEHWIQLPGGEFVPVVE